MKHTPGPWSQGRLLLTRTTEGWTKAERAAGDARERLMVFSQFHERDAGRSRVRVAMASDTVSTEEEAEANARLIAAAPELLEALEIAERSINDDSIEGRAALVTIRAAIAKAKGRE